VCDRKHCAFCLLRNEHIYTIDVKNVSEKNKNVKKRKKRDKNLKKIVNVE